ncbi:signal peptide peptidase SppA [Candidatus Woesearchaeota archaeon]|nr:signal peptide peptidase SppA [Candidatus Woesearchaeota archaeon]
MAKKKKNSARWGIIISVLLFLFIIAYVFSAMISLIISQEGVRQGNVALIPVRGLILTGNSRDFLGSSITPSGKIVDFIGDAAEDPKIKAILLEIDSPGGAPVATDEIAVAIERANKTTVAWIRETGASGAYWIASAAEHIVANRMSITGSIGVYGSYLDFSGFIRDWNVTYQRLVGGRYKDTGIPFRQLSEDEERMLQKKISLLHQIFKDEVQENRALTDSEIENVGTGEFFIGKEALQLNLVDELGGKKEALDYIEQKLNITAQLSRYEIKRTFLDVLAGLNSRQSLDIKARDTIGLLR